MAGALTLGLIEDGRWKLSAGTPDRRIYIGVDLGKQECHSAIVVVERLEELPTDFADVLRGVGVKTTYIVRHAERLPLGMPYTEVVMRVKAVVQQLVVLGTCVVVVDAGGPGVPVVEMLRQVGLGCSLCPLVITSGQKATGGGVPRAELVTRLQMMAERGELKIAGGCYHEELLKRELLHLQLQGGSGKSVRDDLAMGLGLACYKARGRG